VGAKEIARMLTGRDEVDVGSMSEEQFDLYRRLMVRHMVFSDDEKTPEDHEAWKAVRKRDEKPPKRWYPIAGMAITGFFAGVRALKKAVKLAWGAFWMAFLVAFLTVLPLYAYLRPPGYNGKGDILGIGTMFELNDPLFYLANAAWLAAFLVAFFCAPKYMFFTVIPFTVLQLAALPEWDITPRRAMWQWGWALYPALKGVWRIARWMVREVRGEPHVHEWEDLAWQAGVLGEGWLAGKAYDHRRQDF